MAAKKKTAVKKKIPTKKRVVGKKRASKKTPERESDKKQGQSKGNEKVSAKKKVSKKKAVGNPSGFTRKIANSICEQLGAGISLRDICQKKSMPSMSMVFRWLDKNEEFREQYARAREEQAEKLVDEIIDIADQDPERYIDAQGVNRIDPASVNHQRSRLDARKWVAAKLRPKKYGDKSQVELTGKDGGAIATIFEVTLVKPE